MSTLKVNNVTDLGDDAIVTDGVVVGDALPTGSILQVVQGTLLTPFSVTSTSFTPITDLTATITPSSTSSKILILVSAQAFSTNTTNNTSYFRLSGGNSATFVGTALETRGVAAASLFCFASNRGESNDTINITYLDSPNTTSATTYGLDIRATSGATGVNRRNTDNDNTVSPRTASSITLMEVAG